MKRKITLKRIIGIVLAAIETVGLSMLPFGDDRPVWAIIIMFWFMIIPSTIVLWALMLEFTKD